jgi:hypothetical protein
MEAVGMFYVYLLCFTAICHMLWPFGLFSGYSVYLVPFWYVVARKIWQTCDLGENKLLSAALKRL